jgi:dienelactone hydrolase
VIDFPVAAFAYTPAPLQVRTTSATVSGNVRRSLVTFRSGDRTLTAEIFAPVHAGATHPGVLFVHWLGDDATTNHKEFEPDARALAARGATCVLLDAMWSTLANPGRDWFSAGRSTATDYAKSIEQVVDLRRALDLLTAQPGVDPSRIAYVAHDFGAMYGAVLAGVDSRPRYFLLMAGTTSFADWYLLGKKPADVAAYRAQMAPIDPLQYLARSTAKGFMFQFASHDQYVTAQHAAEFFDAAPLPRAMFVYDAQHDLKLPLALHDRLDWLQARLF